jgi:hypothetical protein
MGRNFSILAMEFWDPKKTPRSEYPKIGLLL